MTKLTDQWEIYQQYLNLLEQHLGPSSEIVLHDLKKNYGNTIVDIRNGHISGRKVGDSGGEWGIEVLSGAVLDGNRYNRIIHTRDGKIIRTSTVFLKDKDGELYGSICINTDITDAVRCEEYLHNYNMYNISNFENPSKPAFFKDVNELLDTLIQEAVTTTGANVADLSKEDTEQILRYLDQKGAFLIMKSGDRVCEYLNISKFKLYNTLNIIRSENSASEE